MKRKMMEKLVAWAESGARKPLILQGARQIGKTYLLQELGKTHFEGLAYVNFEQNVRARQIFEGSLVPEILLQNLSAELSMSITPRTLLFFDEIQSCKQALTSLKYFCEQAPEIPVVAAGSLLGVSVRPGDAGFPVGKVTIETLHPMDFEEFLWTCGRERQAALVRDFLRTGAFPSFLHEELIRLYRHYLVVGGMPEAVLTYLDRAEAPDWSAVRTVQMNLQLGALADMTRYASATEARRIQACYQSLPNQLAKPNQKFQYRVVEKGASSRRCEYALEWLVQAGLITLCNRLPRVESPLVAQAEPEAFKAFHMDVGLFAAMAGFRPNDIVAATPGQAFGGLTETYVAEALTANGVRAFYWESEGKAEVDFVYDGPRTPVAVEVKRGQHVRSKSLDVLRQRTPQLQAVRLSEKPFGHTPDLLSLPLYAAFLLGAEFVVPGVQG